MNVAILLTCHNRKEKTVSCITSLQNALNYYNSKSPLNVSYKIFLVDDGCTDGTSEAVLEIVPFNKLCLLTGDGSLYWAGGMRKAWREALNNDVIWDFYLLLNDDTVLLPHFFEQLMEAHNFSLKNFDRGGLYSGICCDPIDHHQTTYGGNTLKRKGRAAMRLYPTGEPQVCDMTNANILLVCKEVVDKIGVFYDKFQHGKADYDYSLQANKNGFPVLVTSDYCGYCPNDHESVNEISSKVCKMSLRERKKYFNHPLHSNSDYIMLIRRNFPLRYPLVLIGRFLNVYFPILYYKIHS